MTDFKSMYDSLFIVIPVFNRRTFTQKCLECLADQSVQGFHVVVIDDGSTDGTAEMIADLFPWVDVLKGDGNLWWAESTNVGVRFALDKGAEYIMTLNDDTEPPVHFIETMMAAAKQCSGGLIGASAVDRTTNELVYAGERINWPRAKYELILEPLGLKERTGLVEVTHFPGRGLLIPAELFRRIGLYDSKHFPQTLSDYDFTHRAKRFGAEIFCCLDARLIIHSESSASVSLRQRKSLKNYSIHLFGIRGGANLPRFIFYGWKNCPKQYLIPFLTLGILRRLLGYWK